MWRRMRRVCVAVGLGLLVTSAMTPATAAVTPRWSPNPSSTENYLNDVSARSHDDAWAVGVYRHNRTDEQRTLALHWNGSRWTRVWTPNGPGGWATLESVVTLAENDAWAVGSSLSRTLIAHWNGTGWTRVPAPQPKLGGQLNAITEIAPDDLWAVGTFQRRASPTTYEDRTYMIHWDGTMWTRVWAPRAPAGYGDERMMDISATGPSDVWAVGSYDDPYYTGGVMALHWDGTSWTRSLLPKLTPYWDSDKAATIEAISPTDVWVGGFPGLWHGNETGWTGQVVEEYGFPVAFWGLSAVSSTEAWGVTLEGSIYHSDGGSWTETYGETPASILSSIGGLYGVDARTSGDVWAVGFDSQQRTLALRWNGRLWVRT